MTYASEVTADAPVLWWRLGDAAGTTATDSSGLGRNGTYTGSPTLGVTGLVGDSNTAVSFDGVDDSVTRSGTIFSNVTACSVEAWFTSTDAGACIFGLSGFNTWIRLEAGSPGHFATVNASGSGIWTGAIATNILDGNRHHVVVTYSAGTASVYCDGVLAATGTTSGNIYITEVRVAIRDDAAEVTRANAVIDEFAIYSTALSGTRIGAHYSAGSPPPPITVHPAKITSIGTVHEPAIVPYVAPVDGNINITAELAPATKHAACIQPDRSAEIAPARHTAGVNAT